MKQPVQLTYAVVVCQFSGCSCEFCCIYLPEQDPPLYCFCHAKWIQSGQHLYEDMPDI